MDAVELIEMLYGCAQEIARVVDEVEDWSQPGGRSGQYHIDVVADQLCVRYLTDLGFGVLSEESGTHFEDRELFAVIDPIDGSTNASRGLPWYATSICVLDDQGPLGAIVVNQSSDVHYEAFREAGAFRDGEEIQPSETVQLNEAIIGLSGYPGAYLGWNQYRALGAIALDLCAVADGTLDGYLDCVNASHGPWDYLAGMFICEQAGAVVYETGGRELLTRGYEDRRSPVAAGTPELANEILRAFHSATSR